ncbi:hypothetical protein I3843_Q065600 [Carya illinoinensis]|nr:hypothetical protein I3843_Q065600 [Carya illinoinensis]
MDINRDGRVSLNEFITFFREHGYDRIDGGSPDVVLHIKTRSAWCRVCGTWLTRLYFTCVTCFDSGGDTYDLCPACYAKHANRPHHGRMDARDLDAIVADIATTPEAHKLAHSMSKYDYDLMEHARDLAATARDIATTPPEDLEKIYDIGGGACCCGFVTACSIM